MNTLQVSSTPKLPLDPSKIQTMADYDLALSLYRTWFNYDSSGKASPGIIASWKFISKSGSYNFTIAEGTQWSDGSRLTSDHLIKNLERIIRSNTSYGIAIESIIDVNKIDKIDINNFSIAIKNREPSEAFFQRMGSIFLAVTHPKDWNAEGNLTNNNITIGPYKILEKNSTDMILDRNKYDKLANDKRIDKIHFKLGRPATNLNDFLENKTFENITQTYTLIPNELYNKIISLKLPFWTRAYDRVSYIAPIKPYAKNSQKLRNFLKALGNKFHEENNDLDIPKAAKKALSLQPKGYPLNDQLNYEQNIQSLPNEVSILAIEGHQYEIQKKVIEKLAKKLKAEVKIKWTTKKTTASFLEELKDNSVFDLKILSFGVADPEASTWLSLVLNKENPFVEISPVDMIEFEKILNSHSGNQKEVLDLKKLLTKIGERGSYLPLFHFSTMSLAQPGISFENINELDETVDYSKLINK